MIGGNAITTASAELIVPTPFVSDKSQNTVRTSLFVDAASVWNTKWKSDKSGLDNNVLKAYPIMANQAVFAPLQVSDSNGNLLLGHWYSLMPNQLKKI